MGNQGKAPGDMSVLLADNQNDLGLLEPAQSNLVPEFPADATISFGDQDGGDVLDLADVLMGEPASDNIDLYLRAISNGESSTLLVDTEGTGNFANPDLVIEVGGVQWDSSIAGQMADLIAGSVILV